MALNQIWVTLFLAGGILLSAAGCTNDSKPADKTPELSCTIYATQLEIDTLTSPDIKVYIRNEGAEPVTVLKATGSSTSGLCGPFCYFNVAKVGSPDWKPEPVGFCGNHDGINRDDFAQLAPGDSIELFAGLSKIFLDPSLEARNYRDTGWYEFTFHYSSESDNKSEYSSGPMKEDWDSETEDLFEQVAHVKLQSNTIRIRVK